MTHWMTKLFSPIIETGSFFSEIPLCRGTSKHQEHSKESPCTESQLRFLADSLDTMEEWVTELFSPIRGNGGPPPTFSPPKDAPPIYQPGLLYKVESVRDQNLLSLTWQLPCLDAHYQSKPHDYVSHLIGHGESTSALLPRGSFWDAFLVDVAAPVLGRAQPVDAA
jgi:hypothetical protein